MINKYYLENPKEIKASFREKKDFPCVVLFDFFEKDAYQLIEKEISKVSFHYEKKPLFHSYSSAHFPIILKKIFSSPECADFITKIIGKKVTHSRAQIYYFSARDYTLLNDSYKEKAGFDIIFDFTRIWDSSAGGQIMYVNGTGDALKLPIQPNSLMIVRRQKNAQRFVKYVNHTSPKKKRVFLLMRI